MKTISGRNSYYVFSRFLNCFTTRMSQSLPAAEVIKGGQSRPCSQVSVPPQIQSSRGLEKKSEKERRASQDGMPSFDVTKAIGGLTIKNDASAFGKDEKAWTNEQNSNSELKGGSSKSLPRFSRWRRSKSSSTEGSSKSDKSDGSSKSDKSDGSSKSSPRGERSKSSPRGESSKSSPRGTSPKSDKSDGSSKSSPRGERSKSSPRGASSKSSPRVESLKSDKPKPGKREGSSKTKHGGRSAQKKDGYSTSKQRASEQKFEKINTPVEVRGFPADITFFELTEFFSSMHPVQNVLKKIDPEDNSIAVATVTFKDILERRSFLSRRTLLYDDTELSISTKVAESPFDIVNESILRITCRGPKRKKNIDFLEIFTEKNVEVVQVEFDYSQQIAYVRFKEPHMAKEILDDVFKGSRKSIKFKNSTLRAEILSREDDDLKFLKLNAEIKGYEQSVLEAKQKRIRLDTRLDPMRKGRYEPYWSTEEVTKGLKSGDLVKGPLKINMRNWEECYIPAPDGTRDILICGVENRNRALTGDIVAVQIHGQDQWKVVGKHVKRLMGQPENSDQASPSSDTVKKDKKTQKKNVNDFYTPLGEILSAGSPTMNALLKNGKIIESRETFKQIQQTGKVVSIVEPKHSRSCVGYLKPYPYPFKEAKDHWNLFFPTDSRIPRILTPRSDCPDDFHKRHADYSTTLFVAKIFSWDIMFPYGILKQSIGESGDIETETLRILIENEVDHSEFSQEALDSLPIQTLPWTIPREEYNKRRDFRNQCVFTIDPSTARDLDDALSIEVLEDDLFEVGVHIADVSYFLQESTELDKVASSRATSVYLVQKVIPMLPRILCEELCSLNPDQDRLTFSVTWKMNSAGEIFEEWFGRSIIKSCTKLSYDHAQGFIEDPDKDWNRDELPPISEGFTVDDIKKRVLGLNKIAVNLRRGRFNNGALRLDQVKLQFSLDKETMMPNGYSVYEQRDSNRLVEEFMLLANMAVAHKIYKTFPEKAMLRMHPPPQTRMADELSDLCENLGVPIDISSAGALQTSMRYYMGQDDFSKARMQVLVSMCSKPMQMAKYFCTGSIDDEELFRHYALNVPLYTHFTSPIRRYADVIVHRLLAAALGYCEETDKSTELIQRQATICNDKKLNAKRAQDLSTELYFAALVKEAGPLEEKAMVMGVLDMSVDVFVLRLGVTKRIFLGRAESIKEFKFLKEQDIPVLNVVWKPLGDSKDEVTQRMTIFTEVNCTIEAINSTQWSASINHPSLDTGT